MFFIDLPRYLLKLCLCLVCSLGGLCGPPATETDPPEDDGNARREVRALKAFFLLQSLGDGVFCPLTRRSFLFRFCFLLPVCLHACSPSAPQSPHCSILFLCLFEMPQFIVLAVETVRTRINEEGSVGRGGGVESSKLQGACTRSTFEGVYVRVVIDCKDRADLCVMGRICYPRLPLSVKMSQIICFLAFRMKHSPRSCIRAPHPPFPPSIVDS